MELSKALTALRIDAALTVECGGKLFAVLFVAGHEADLNAALDQVVKDFGSVRAGPERGKFLSGGEKFLEVQFGING